MTGIIDENERMLITKADIVLLPRQFMTGIIIQPRNAPISVCPVLLPRQFMTGIIGLDNGGNEVEAVFYYPDSL